MKLFGREQGSMAVKMDLSVDSNIDLTRWRGRDEKNFIDHTTVLLLIFSREDFSINSFIY